MATTVRFGRLPRSAPSLTATIVALSQQYEAQRERNLFDAWNQGGDWEGKEATDKVLMKFLKEKLEGLDPSDPNANATRIQIASYEFAIENSEMELKYAQGKVSDTGMASFYRKWAAKLPRDSEAYRDRATLAAQYADRAHAASAARSRAASDKAYYDKQKDIESKQIAPFEQLMVDVQAMMRSGIIGYIEPSLNTSSETLADLRASEFDSTQTMAILDTLANDPGLKEWRDNYVKGVRAKGGVISDNPWSQDGIIAMHDQAIDGINQQIKVAKANGRQSDVEDLRKRRDAVRDSKSQVSTVDEKKEYEERRKEWQETVNDPDSTAAVKIAATSQYANSILKLAERAKKAGDDVLAGKLNTEFIAANGGRDKDGKDVNSFGPTLWESGRNEQADHPGIETGAGGLPVGDAASTALSVRELEAQVNALREVDEFGRPLYAQVRVNDKGEPTNSPGYGFDVRPIASLSSAVFEITDADASNDGERHLTAVVPTPITLAPKTKPDQNGQQQDVAVGGSKQALPLGGAYKMADGTTLLAFRDSSGAIKYAPMTADANGNVSLFTDGNGNPTGKIGRDANGNVTVTVELDDKQAKSVNDKGTAVANFINPSYYNAETNKNMPGVVFNSPMAYEMAKDPDKAYGKYTPQQLDQLAGAMAGGNKATFDAIRGEIDAQRAEYVTGGDMSFDQKMRIASARKNGTMPLLSDYVGGVTSNGFNIRGTSIDTAENRALAEKFGGKTPDQIMADAVLERFGYTTDALAQAWKTGTAARYGPPAPGQTWATMAQQSRGLATNLVKDIWWQATQAPVAAPKPVTPGPSLPPTGGGRGYVPPPIQQGTPAPTPAAPKPSAPPPTPAPGPSMPPTGAGRGWSPSALPKPTPPPGNPYRNIFSRPSGPAAGPTANYNSYTGFRLW